MKRILVLLFLLYGSAGLAQETTIRILGAFPSSLSLSSSDMTSQLQGIATAWNNSGLPGAAITTVQLLNSAVAIPVNYPLLPNTMDETADVAHQESSIQALRHMFKAYPGTPPVLNPPINLYGINLGCWDGVYTRHDLYWSDDPGTNVPVSHYEVWKSQPVGQPFVYGWSVYGPSTQSYVVGATARARVNACSGYECSALSQTFYDANPVCNNW